MVPARLPPWLSSIQRAQLFGVESLGAPTAMPRWMHQLQTTQLFGVEDEQGHDYDESPYVGGGMLALGGAPMAPYDLNQPGAVSEIKAFINSLNGVIGSPSLLTVNDVWDAETGEQMLVVVAFLRPDEQAPLGVMPPGPYWQLGPSGGSPQPTAMGLELLDGWNYDPVLGIQLKNTPLKMYEAWRAAGCAANNVGGICPKPYSAIGRPPAGTPVTVTQNTGPRLPSLPIVDTYTQIAAGADAAQRVGWMNASFASTQGERTDALTAMEQNRATRDQAVLNAGGQWVGGPAPAPVMPIGPNAPTGPTGPVGPAGLPPLAPLPTNVGPTGPTPYGPIGPDAPLPPGSGGSAVYWAVGGGLLLGLAWWMFRNR